MAWDGSVIVLEALGHEQPHQVTHQQHGEHHGRPWIITPWVEERRCQVTEAFLNEAIYV